MTRRFRIDDWIAAPDLNTFTRAGRVVRVEPKVMELCVRLARSAGSVVTKAELLDSVWADAVVGEDALTRAMSELRRALDDDARHPRVIETIPKRGYRLVAAVSEMAPVPDAAEAPPPEPAPAAARRIASTAAAAIALTVVTALGVVWLAGSTDEPPTVAAGTPERYVVVAGLRASTGAAGLAETLGQLVEDELGRVAALTPMPPERIASVMARMRKVAGPTIDADTAREIAAREDDVAGFVTGRVVVHDGTHAASLQVWSSTGDVVARLSAQAPTASGLKRAIASRARALAVLAKPAAPARRPLPRVTTSSLDALRAFAQAVEMADAHYASVTGPWETVVHRLREALRLDPEFAAAKVWLALVLQTADLERLTYVGGTPQLVESYLALAEDASRGAAGLPEPERLFVEGAAAALVGRHDHAVASLEALLWSGSRLFEIRARRLLISLFFRQARWQDLAEQAAAMADLLPNDFDANADAARAFVQLDRRTSRAARYASRARDLLPSADTQRENSCWQAAWIEHLPVFERWTAGDLEAAAAIQERIASSLPNQVAYLRDAMATTNGHFWLALGRVGEARRAFDLVGHVGQREMNFAMLANLAGDRQRVRAHLDAMGWAHSATIFAVAGWLDRANEIIRTGTASNADRLLVEGLEAVAARQAVHGTSLLQQAVDLLRGDAGWRFYEASLALADAWATAGHPQQVVRVLEESSAEPPAYTIPGLQAAWSTKVKVRLIQEYRRTGQGSRAAALEREVRALLSQADADHPFLAALAIPARPSDVSTRQQVPRAEP